MGSNMQRLGDTLSGRMKKTVERSVPTTVELGIINPNLSLTTDSLKSPIPKGDYMVDIQLTHDSYHTETATHSHTGGDHTHDGGSHDHRLPPVFRSLQPGDRVLVVWCGNEPVVTNILVSS